MPTPATTEPPHAQQHEQSHRQQRRVQHSSIEPIALRVPDACRYLGVGRSTLYVLISQGEIEIVKLGSATLVLTDSLSALVERRRNHLHSLINVHAANAQSQSG